MLYHLCHIILAFLSRYQFLYPMLKAFTTFEPLTIKWSLTYARYWNGPNGFICKLFFKLTMMFFFKYCTQIYAWKKCLKRRLKRMDVFRHFIRPFTPDVIKWKFYFTQGISGNWKRNRKRKHVRMQDLI